MHPDLEQLRIADAHDRTLRDLRKQKKVLEERLTGARARSTAAAADVARLDHALDANAQRQRELQRTIEQYENRRTSAQRVLETGAGDADAAQRQLDGVAAQLDALETELLERMEQQESDTAARVAARAEQADADAFLEAEEVQNPIGIAGLRAKFDAVLPLRRAALDALDAHIVDRYETLVARKGRAVAEVRAGSCGACQMVVRQQHIADLRRGLVQTCGGCGRWLLLLDADG
jgi:hypothetical protein